MAIIFAAFFLSIGIRPYRRARRRTMTVGEDGLTVQRDKYRLFVPWSEVDSVSRQRRQLVLVVDELRARESTVIAVDARGQQTRLPRGLDQKPYARRIHLNLYDREWRDGVVGQRLGAMGVI